MLFTHATEVWKVPAVQWERAQENEMSCRFHKVLQRWIPFAVQQYREWDGRPNCGHFFGGTFWYQADSANVSVVMAALSRLGEYDESVTGVPQKRLKQMAVSAIRYMGFTHDTGPADCVRVAGVLPYTSEKKWGGQGDNFFMASQNGRNIAAMACAAWLLWDELDVETKLLVQDVTASYADRWADEEPRNGVYYDTQCEENAWTSAGISAALAMFPEHPHHEQWQKGFINWAMNAVSTFKDRLLYPSGLVDTHDGLKVSTVTFHPDFTSENHAFVHPSYYSAGTNLRAIHGLFSLMSGQPMLEAGVYNNVPLYERTIKIWSQFDGLNIPVQGQDWWYNRQHERQLTHTILNVLHGHPDAARFARNALTSIERIQASNTKGVLLEENGEECVINRAHAQFAKDLEHGSAYDLATSYLLHVFGGPGANPTDHDELQNQLSGVYKYPFGGSIIHRTPKTFTSFTWRNNVMALTLPSRGLWHVTPLYASYTGTLQIESESESQPAQSGSKALTNESIIRSVEREHVAEYADGFGAVVAFQRGANGELQQDVGFAALPDGSSVYAERFHVRKPCRVGNWQTGTIGIRNESYSQMPELAPGQRTLHLENGSHTFRGFYGQEPDQVEHYGVQRYVNVDNNIGYVLFNTRGVKYINRHEYPKWKGVEDILVLNDFGDVAFNQPQQLDTSVIVSLPNQTAAQTAASADNTRQWASGDADIELIEVEHTLVAVSFSGKDKAVTASVPSHNGKMNLYPGSSYSLQDQAWTWSGSVAAFSSSYRISRFSLELEKSEGVELEIIASFDRTVILKKSKGDVAVRITDRNTLESKRVVLLGDYYVIPTQE